MIVAPVSFVMILHVLCEKSDLDRAGDRNVTMMVTGMSRLPMTPENEASKIAVLMVALAVKSRLKCQALLLGPQVCDSLCSSWPKSSVSKTEPSVYNMPRTGKSSLPPKP